MMADINTNNVQHSVSENGRFKNPWPNWCNPKFRDVLRFVFWDKNKSKIPTQEVKRELKIFIRNVPKCKFCPLL